VRLDWLHDGSVWLKGAYWGASLEFSPSSTHYDGSTQPDYLPLQQDTANQFYRLNGFFGFHFLDWVSSYSGLGARVWLRGTSRVNAGVFTAAEQYYWLELPLGLRLEQGWGSSWSFALDASIRWLFLGGIAIKFSEVASNRSDSTGALGNRLGAKLEGSARCRLSERFSVGLVPWLEYSAIGKGGNFDIVTAGQATVQGYEPASRSWEYGLRLEASFHQ
jgi:opacity protein-like surface antigen